MASWYLLQKKRWWPLSGSLGSGWDKAQLHLLSSCAPQPQKEGSSLFQGTGAVEADVVHQHILQLAIRNLHGFWTNRPECRNSQHWISPPKKALLMSGRAAMAIPPQAPCPAMLRDSWLRLMLGEVQVSFLCSRAPVPVPASRKAPRALLWIHGGVALTHTLDSSSAQKVFFSLLAHFFPFSSPNHSTPLPPNKSRFTF